MTTDLETLRRLAIREAERQAELCGPLSPTYQRLLDDFRRGEGQLGSILKMAERWAAEEKRFQEQAQALATPLSWDHNPLLGADVERRLREAESIATLVDRADVRSPFNNWARLPDPDAYGFGEEQFRRAVREEVRRVFAERDPQPAKRDGSLYGNDGVKRTPGFKSPKDK